MKAAAFEKLPEAQREGFRELVKWSGYGFEEILSRSLAPTALCPYIGVPNFHGMYVGVEEDGYTHS